MARRRRRRLRARMDRRAIIMAVMILVVLLATALRLYGLDDRDLWGDEVYEVGNATRAPSWSEPLQHFPVRYVLAHLFIRIADGEWEFVARFPYVAAGILAAAAAYRVGRVLLDAPTGLVTAFLLAVSTFHIRYSQEARSYGFTVLLALASLLCLWRALQTNRLRYWGGFSVLSALTLNNHLTAGVVLASEVLLAAFAVLRRWPPVGDSGPSPGEERTLLGARWTSRPAVWLQRARSSRLAMLGLSLALSIVLILPASLFWFVYTQQAEVSVARAGTGQEAVLQLSLPFLRELLSEFGGGGGWSLWLYGAALVAGVALWVAERRWSLLLLSSVWCALPLVVLSQLRIALFFGPRHLIFILVMVLLLASSGLVGFARRLSSLLARVSPLRARSALGVALLVAGCSAVFGLAGADRMRTYYTAEEIYDLGGAAQFLRDHVEPEDRVALFRGYFSSGVLWYYGIPALGTSWYGWNNEYGGILRMEDSPDWLQRLSERHDRIWLVGSEIDFRRLSPSTAEWIEGRFFEIYFVRTPVFVSAGDSELSLEERVALLEEAARLSEGTYNYRLYLDLGGLYSAAGDWPRAIAAYERATSFRPDLIGTHGALAGALRDSGDLQGAIQAYLTILRLAPENAVYRVSLGRLYLTAGDIPGALEQIERAAALDPGYGDAYVGLGDAHLARGAVTQALSAYQQAVQVDPGLAGAYLALARLHLAQGEVDLAAEQCEQALRVAPDDPLALLEAANVYLIQGRDEEAVVALRQARASTVGRVAWVHHLLAEALWRAGDVAAAVEEYEEAIRLEPWRYSTYGRLAEAYLAQGEVEGAIRAAEQTIALAQVPAERAAGHVALGAVFEFRGDVDEAVAQYRQAVELAPTNATARLRLGNIYWQLSQADPVQAGIWCRLAATQYAEAAGLLPEDERPVLGLGQVALACGSAVEAERWFREALSLGADVPRVRMGLGDALREQGRWADAMAEYQLLLELQPDDYVAHVRLGQVYHAAGRLDEAAAEYQTATELSPGSSWAHSLLGDVLEELGEWELAISARRAVLTIEPDRPGACYDIGWCLEQLGLFEEALTQYRQCVPLDPYGRWGTRSLERITVLESQLSEGGP